MSVDTEFERWVRAELAEIAEPVMPRPDPYGRLVRRHRVGWLRGGLVAGVATLAVGSAVALSPAGSPPAPPPPDGALRWVEELVDGPPRGALAADEPFRTDLTESVTDLVRAGARHSDLTSVIGRDSYTQDVRLIFADDIEDKRFVLLALRLPTAPEPDELRIGRTKMVWLIGPRGATAGSLVSALTSNPLPDVTSGSTIAAPFTIAVVDQSQVGQVGVGLAPPGCEVSSAPASDPDDWTREPTSSYLVRTSSTFEPERWRVTCDGMVREERDAPWYPSTDSVPDDMIEPARTDLIEAGYDEVTVLLDSAHTMVRTLGPYLAGPPRLLYAGNPPPGFIDNPRQAGTQSFVVMIAPTVFGDWVVGPSLWNTDLPDPNLIGSGSTLGEFRVDTDPFDPRFTFAFFPGIGSVPQIMAVLTPTAATATLVDIDGTALLAAPVVDRATVFTVPESHSVPVDVGTGRVPVEGLRVEAYDAFGSHISTTPLADTGFFDISTNWD